MGEERSTAGRRCVSESEALAIGAEAYHYVFPLVLMDVTRRTLTNLAPDAGPGMGPMNLFSHLRSLPLADRREVVRPNFDTLYSSAWLDLTDGPVIVSAPDTSGRFYMLPMMDMWSEVFASPGRRTSGTGAGHWAVVPPGWRGQLPDGVDHIEAPTPYVWIIGRVLTSSPEDYDDVRRIQDGLSITPLSTWGGTVRVPKATIDPEMDMGRPPIVQVATMPAARFFAYAAELMKLHPPHPTDWSQLARLGRIGLEAGEGFDLSSAPPSVRTTLERAAAEGLRRMRARSGSIAPIVRGWQVQTATGVYGNDYLRRAVAAMIGLGANQSEDALYPICVADQEGRPPDGSRKYALHFPPGRLPPVGALWSVTLYDRDGFAVLNPIDRHALGSRDDLALGSDGSLTIHVQHGPPEGGARSNWLPSPATGRFSLTMRLYEPSPLVLDGRWYPPPLTDVSTNTSSVEGA